MKQIFTITIAIIFASVSLKSQSTFQSIASGNWNSPSTWTLTAGTSTLGYPSGALSDVTIATGHTVTINLTSVSCKTITIQSNGALTGTGKKLFVNGDFTNHGRVISSALNLYMTTAGSKFFSPSVYNATGTIWAQKSFTIMANSIIDMKGGILIQNSNTSIVNEGSVTFKNPNSSTLNGTVRVQATNNNNKWTNKAGSSLSVETVPTLKPSLFICTASSNTVTYSGLSTSVLATTYDNLTLTGARNYTLTSNLTVNNTLTFSLSTIPTLLSVNLNNKKITLNGNFVSSGNVISLGNDTLLFTGAQTLQTVSGNRTNSFARVIIDKPNLTDEILFTSTLRISKELIMVKGTCNANNSNLVLLSDATNTAYIDKVTNPTDVNFTGNMVIQKSLPYYEGPAFDYFYHAIGSPVQSTTINDWDNELYISGIGPYDGQSGPVGVDGDVYNGYASMLVYDEPTNVWNSLTGSTTTLTPGIGYTLLFMDSLNSGTNVGKFFVKTLTTVGAPNFGDVSVPVTFDLSGSNMIANPYASPINLSSGMSGSSNITAIYYLNNGAYEDGDLTDVIAPHQAFLAEVDGSGDVIFTEDCKVADNASLYNRKKPKYDIKLNISSSVLNYSHEAKICFTENASINYDKKIDARYIKTPTEGLPAIFTIDALTNTQILKNTVSDNTDELSLPIGIYTPKAGMYHINSAVINLGNYNYAWIENKVSGEKFDLNKDIAIEGKDRQTNTDYVLHFAQKRTISSVDPTILTDDLLIFSTENTINLKSTFTDYSITNLFVYDMSGKLVLEQRDVNVTAGKISKVDVSHLSNGLYIIKTIDNQGKINTHKLIK